MHPVFDACDTQMDRSQRSQVEPRQKGLPRGLEKVTAATLYAAEKTKHHKEQDETAADDKRPSYFRPPR